MYKHFKKREVSNIYDVMHAYIMIYWSKIIDTLIFYILKLKQTTLPL